MYHRSDLFSIGWPVPVRRFCMKVGHKFYIQAFCFVLSGCCLFDFDPGVSGGCSATGEEVVARFDFMQPGDPSEAADNAFSAGTFAHLEIEPLDDDSELPPWDIASSDENIMTVDEILEDVLYPVKISMKNNGPVELRVTKRENQQIIDYLKLRVKEPDGFGVKIYHGVADTDPHRGNILIAPGGGLCRLKFYPYELTADGEKFLYGEYNVGISGGEGVFNFYHRMFEEEIALFFTTNISNYLITMKAVSEGSDTVTFTGPHNLKVIKDVRTPGINEIIDLNIEITPYWDETPEAGDTGHLVGIQRTADGRLCRGFPVKFETDTPDIIWLCDESQYADDYTKFEFLAPGTVVVKATLQSDPPLVDTITIEVDEP